MWVADTQYLSHHVLPPRVCRERGCRLKYSDANSRCSLCQTPTPLCGSAVKPESGLWGLRKGSARLGRSGELAELSSTAVGVQAKPEEQALLSTLGFRVRPRKATSWE